MIGPLRDWRPRALREGGEPDARFTLANERTFLAWIRTALGVIAAAVALETFAGDVVGPVVRTTLSCALLVFSAVLVIAALRRWLQIEAAMRTERPLPPPRIAFLLAAMLAVGALALTVALLV
ncbi:MULTISPECIES: YidH family protein [Rhodococcus]|uniref:DUF202 domain-containing protein n=3 Tax=Rhodococcus TaxID=1827 RepID=M2ZNN4_9NOCA|nr:MULTISPECIES: DUF202 domain-containing protein [Rhodococcus]EME62443.1 hypothetical protein G352_17854 [Rhodococcus ruber BKS 20-38]KOS54751.1 membrane protein [Rhodococcus rhodochrous KG-21]MDM7490834.1 DUF202 domain-containing protein [Rhodococcus indonesiensis]